MPRTRCSSRLRSLAPFLPARPPGRRPPRLTHSRRPADLAGHVRLSSLHRPHDWPVWLAAAGDATVEGRSAITFDNAALAYQAAVDGLGVAVAQRAFIEDDLRSGRLVMPLARSVATQEAYYLGFHPDRARAPRIAAFEAWLLAEAARTDAGAA